MKQLKSYSPLEEKINIWSHLFGVVISLFWLIAFIYKGISIDNTIYLISCTIYGAAALNLFTASTLYHSEKNLSKRKRLQVFDHISIYLLIAGGYTPLSLIAIGGVWGWSIFGVAWGVGVTGIILKLFFTGRYSLISTISYVAMGWIMIAAVKPLLNNLSTDAIIWLAIGGISYTVGAALYSIKKVPYNHAIFHIFVVGGYISHSICIYYYL